MEISTMNTTPDLSIPPSNNAITFSGRTFFLTFTHHVPPRFYIPPVNGISSMQPSKPEAWESSKLPLPYFISFLSESLLELLT